MTHTALAICPHADDAAAFFGGTLTKFAAEGWNVILVRVTDDRTDSVGASIEETIRVNTEQLHAAAKIMGVSEIVELGYTTDSLATISALTLRERFIYLFRKYRPYAVFSFDPFGINENNQDHIVVAQAVDEAFWTASYDKHHPEHFEEGLAPFSVCERWYYGRELPGANYVEDITEHFGASVDALVAHDMMMRNLVQQLRLQAETWGKRIPTLEAARTGELKPLLMQFLQGRAAGVAQAFGLGEGRLGEVFRLDRFGDLEAFMQLENENIPGAPEAPKRAGLDR